MTAQDRVTPYDATHAEGLEDWRYLLGALVARFDTPSPAAGAALAVAIAEVGDRMHHHPEVDLRADHLVVRTRTEAADGITQQDLDLAHAVSDLASSGDAAARPLAVSSLELAIDTVDASAIRPFWVAVLGLQSDARGDLRDPDGHLPSIWFQDMDPPRTDRNRIHLDITVPHDVAEQRVAAALAAGGRLVADDRAPAWWILADAEGNEICVCTWQARSTSGEPGSR
ncbi:pterin-4-alpha-carbinolamine dehydratase [Ornithinimicrobium ciconiae]|uniref:Putative pterin-4-alpha-carbinolamine dehydratase n=1 Tax=Ornithinimicrobium ciconiae TaxID=2594265 RepID=A0A516GE12_9MICO|nr:VOC family protein [Ornithinimicrobium ciconiae]QDO89767.1 pterin-4-alpha-carbinolamine dehydratase [Ornithinimicrobium ciconiae]